MIIEPIAGLVGAKQKEYTVGTQKQTLDMPWYHI